MDVFGRKIHAGKGRERFNDRREVLFQVMTFLSFILTSFDVGPDAAKATMLVAFVWVRAASLLSRSTDCSPMPDA